VEDPDSSKQLPLLAHSARIVALPRPVARVAAVVPESAAPVTTLKASPSLWYALVFPQLAEQTPSRQQQIL
jgi:hypothetical protein